MSDELTIELGNQIALFGAQFQAMVDKSDTALAAVLAAANNITSVFTTNFIYFNAVTGSDDNDGRSADKPIKTWAKLNGLLNKLARNLVYFQTDAEANTAHFIATFPYIVEFLSSESGVRRKIRLVDDPVISSYLGGVFSYSNATIASRDIDWEMAYDSPRSAVQVTGFLLVILINARMTRTGTGGALFQRSSAAHFEVSNIQIDPSASGHLIRGLAAGGDPNSLNGVSANFNTN